MSRPACPLHPNGDIQRYGHYGKRKQYVRWQCIPDNGDKPHMVRPALSSKQHGGPDGECLECERVWEDTDGMPIATGDRFTLREKTTALIALANGASYREAAEAVRKRAGYYRRRRGVKVASPDGRLTADWVSQYAPILADAYLPKSWPRFVCLDHLPIHNRDLSSNTPRPSGVTQYNVFAASSYIGDKAVVWRYFASPTRQAKDWINFFGSLPGEPQYVISDQEYSMLSGIRQAWPYTRCYPCVGHLRINVEEKLRKAGLSDRRRKIHEALHDHTFSDPAAYAAFRNRLDRYLAADISKLKKSQEQGIVGVRNWLRDNQDAIARSLVEKHWPISVGSLETPLRTVRAALENRGCRNLDRLNHLLVLLQLKQMGLADEREWARILRDNHRDHGGRPPPRRYVDDPALRPR